MPHAINPVSRNWLGSANNRLTPDSYPYPLGGTFASGFRGKRIRQLFEELIKLVSHIGLAEREVRDPIVLWCARAAP